MDVFIVECVEYKFYECIIMWCINDDDSECIIPMTYHFN